MDTLIYIVEDDRSIREIEAFSLKNAGYIVEEFEKAADFYRRMETKKPHIILLDIMLPDEDGLDIVKKIRKNSETSNIPIILVTAKTTEIDKVKGFDVGADDYITKPFGIMELISRVRALLRRSRTIREEKILVYGDICMNMEKHVVTVGDEPCELTYKEYELLKLFMYNSGIVLERDVIMEKIWGIDYEGESRTLDMHIKTLRSKLGGSGSCIKTVRNVGYRME